MAWIWYFSKNNVTLFIKGLNVFLVPIKLQAFKFSPYNFFFTFSPYLYFIGTILEDLKYPFFVKSFQNRTIFTNYNILDD